MKQEKLHLKFAIHINGTIENIILNGTPNALVKKKNLLEDISEWNFWG
jgi:hypothetical protein